MEEEGKRRNGNQEFGPHVVLEEDIRRSAWVHYLRVLGIWGTQGRGGGEAAAQTVTACSSGGAPEKEYIIVAITAVTSNTQWECGLGHRVLLK